jgi:hypothetical protein
VEFDGTVVRPEEYQRQSVMTSFLQSWTTAEEGALTGDVAVGPGSKGTKDVEGEMGLLPTCSDGDGVILRWPAMVSKVAGGARATARKISH